MVKYRILFVLLAVSLAGCSGWFSSTNNSTTTMSSTATTTTTTTTEAPEWETLEERNRGEYDAMEVVLVDNRTAANASDTVHFEDLSAAEQQEFLQALENGGRLEAPEEWDSLSDSKFVLYQGRWYQVRVSVG